MLHQIRPNERLRLCLVSMPWQSLETPCLPIGLLKRVARGSGLVSEVHEVLGSMRWAEYLIAHTDGEIVPPDFTYIAETGLFHGIGDWVFASALYDDPDWRVDEFRAYLSSREVDPGKAFEMRPHVEPFVEQLATSILELEPDAVGFSTTFMQNVPSLSVARRLKERRPELAVMFGGGNCDGEMGPSLQREFPFVDYAVSGEGEIAFAELLEVLTGGRDPASVRGLSYWREGRQQVNEPRREPTPPGAVPLPDFDQYFEELPQSPVRAFVEPKLLLESARGCWWGEVHHCTFCGLNGSLMKFRSKPADAAFEELDALVRRYRVLDVIVVDNIIDNTYYEALLPRLAETGWDLRIHYEIKSNIRTRHADRLRDARVAHVQPGVESLISTVLKLMDKGVSGTHNVEALRELESASLTASWNWLYGFPGEKDEDYLAILEQVPLLYHLQPPSGPTRISLQRFSPNYTDPGMGFAQRQPAELYRHVYHLDDDAMAGMAYMFDSVNQGIAGDVVAALKEGLSAWSDAYPDSHLVAEYRDDEIRVDEGRVGREPRTYVLDDPVEVRLLAALRQERRAGKLERFVKDVPGASPARVESALDELLSLGLVFAENERMVALPTTAVATKVTL